MPKNPPDGYPTVSPYLLYEDVAGALDFLAKAFGFEERMRIPGPGDSVAHAEMTLGDGVVMMGCPGPDFQNPGKAGYSNAMIAVYVDDVDAHHQRAKAAGSPGWCG